MNRKLSAGVKIWCVLLLVAFCLGAASPNAKADTLYLDPDSLMGNSGWTGYPINNTAYFVSYVDEHPLRQPGIESPYVDYISSYDPGSGREVHSVAFAFEDCDVNATSLTLWFCGSGYPTMYPFELRVTVGGPPIQFNGLDYTIIDMRGGPQWVWVVINQSFSAAELNALTVEITRRAQSNPDKGYSKVYQFYAEVTY